MPLQEIEAMMEFVKDKAREFGAKPMDDANRSYVFRKNIDGDALQDNGGYFGLISADEEITGQYHDFSLTVNPTLDGKPWYVNICIGTNGFKNDYDLATRPGLRRLFSRMVDSNGFCKSDFTDMETSLPKSLTQRDDLQHFKNTFKKYSKLYTAFQIIFDPSDDRAKQQMAAFVAGYARLRDWPTNAQHRNAISKALEPFTARNDNIEIEVEGLLRSRRYLILQGPPGTGKTRLAKLLCKNLEAVTFFTQFHAETSYSDFIYGIRPDLVDDGLKYVSNRGTFTAAVQFAVDNPDISVVLVIDEINRANLSNVLGPIFYLFEHRMDAGDVEIEIDPQLSISRLPSNLFVVATMNTADRSLAVVDFALRRRFAWYSIKPEPIASTDFHGKDFERLKAIFDWYASSEELALQPGQGYFLAADEDEMTNRIRYELFPLIQEYLQEGLLRSAREEFNSYFFDRINKSLFE